jgi:hypothetical protein
MPKIQDHSHRSSSRSTAHIPHARARQSKKPEHRCARSRSRAATESGSSDGEEEDEDEDQVEEEEVEGHEDAEDGDLRCVLGLVELRIH